MENIRCLNESDEDEYTREIESEESEDENEILKYYLFESLQKQQNLESKVNQLTKDFNDFKKQANEFNFKDNCGESKSLSDEIIKSHFDNEILMLKKNFEDQISSVNKKVCNFTSSIDLAFIRNAKFENSQIKQNEEHNARKLLDLHRKFVEIGAELNLLGNNSKKLELSNFYHNNREINTEITMNGLIEGKLILDDKVQKLEEKVAALEKDMKNANDKIYILEKKVAKLERKLFRSKVAAICASIPFGGSIIQTVMSSIEVVENVTQ